MLYVRELPFRSSQNAMYSSSQRPGSLIQRASRMWLPAAALMEL